MGQPRVSHGATASSRAAARLEAPFDLRWRLYRRLDGEDESADTLSRGEARRDQSLLERVPHDAGATPGETRVGWSACLTMPGLEPLVYSQRLQSLPQPI